MFSKMLLFVMPLSAALGWAGEKDAGRFEPGPASSYSSKQTNGNITVAAVPFVSDEETRPAFGKHNPNQYGILPVLVIVNNGSDEALRMSSLQAAYERPDGRQIENTPAADVPALTARLPKDGTGNPAPTIPLPIHIKRKNPLQSWQIDGRAFTAKMLPAHESASGFFYFQTRLQPGAKFYLSGLMGARTNQAILFFEIPLEERKPPAR